MTCYMAVPEYDGEGGSVSFYLTTILMRPTLLRRAAASNDARAACPSRKPVSRYLCWQRFAARPPVVGPRVSRPSPAALRGVAPRATL